MMNKKATHVFIMIMAASLLGLAATLVDLLYKAGYSIQDLTNVQYVFAAILLWMIVLPMIRKQIWPRGRDWIILAGTGVMGAGGMYFYFQSLTVMPVSLSIIFLFQFTWMNAIFDIVIKRRWPTPKKWIGIGVIFVGTLLSVGLNMGQNSGIPLSHAAIGLLAAFCFAWSLYLPEYMKGESSPLLRAAITLTFAAISLFPVYPPTFLISGVLWDGFIGWGVLLALIGQVIPVCCMLISIPRIGGRMAGVLGAAELPATVLSAYLILGEQVSRDQKLGVLLILAGIAMSEIGGAAAATRRDRQIELLEK